MFGKLSLDAVPFHEPIVMVTIAGIILGGLALVGLITYFGKWTYLWKEWLTSVDHKRLGIMYIIVAIVMLLRGFADAIMMRSQQALAAAGEAGVAHLLRLFAEDMKVTMTLTGATSPSAISLDCLDRLEQDQHRTHAVPVSLPA